MIPIIDCGHGGTISGEYQTKGKKQYHFDDGFSIYEGEINRAIGFKLAELLDEYELPYDPFTIHIQKDLTLQNRVNVINAMHKELPNSYLLSIHSNSASSTIEGEGTNANGFEILVYKSGSESEKLANIAKEVYQRRFPNFRFRGIKEQNVKILRETNCPAILCENLFFDNRKEAEYLSSMEGQWNIARCLFEIVQKNYKL